MPGLDTADLQVLRELDEMRTGLHLRLRYEWTVRMWKDLERLAGQRGLSERVVSALYAAAVGELRRTTYQQDESLSRTRPFATSKR